MPKLGFVGAGFILLVSSCFIVKRRRGRKSRR